MNIYKLFELLGFTKKEDPELVQALKTVEDLKDQVKIQEQELLKIQANHKRADQITENITQFLSIANKDIQSKLKEFVASGEKASKEQLKNEIKLSINKLTEVFESLRESFKEQTDYFNELDVQEIKSDDNKGIFNKVQKTHSKRMQLIESLLSKNDYLKEKLQTDIQSYKEFTSSIHTIIFNAKFNINKALSSTNNFNQFTYEQIDEGLLKISQDLTQLKEDIISLIDNFNKDLAKNSNDLVTDLINKVEKISSIEKDYEVLTIGLLDQDSLMKIKKDNKNKTKHIKNIVSELQKYKKIDIKSLGIEDLSSEIKNYFEEIKQCEISFNHLLFAIKEEIGIEKSEKYLLDKINTTRYMSIKKENVIYLENKVGVLQKHIERARNFVDNILEKIKALVIKSIKDQEEFKSFKLKENLELWSNTWPLKSTKETKFIFEEDNVKQIIIGEVKSEMQRFYSAIDRFSYVANSKKQTPEMLTNNYLNKIKPFLINENS